MYDLTEFLCISASACNTMNKVESEAKITKLYFWLHDQKVSQTKGGGFMYSTVTQWTCTCSFTRETLLILTY